MARSTPRTINRVDYRPPDYLVDRIALEFDLGEERTLVRSRLAVRANYDPAEGGRPLRFDGDGLELKSLRLDGQPLGESEYVVDRESLTIFEPSARGELEIETEICPTSNTRLEGLYVSNGVFCTQCEAEGFRHITFFPDRPDVLAVYTVTVRADREKFPILLSNGNLVEERELEDGRHLTVWHDPFPKPSYLFALVAGDLGMVEDRFETASGRPVRLRIFTEHGNERKCDYAMDALKRAMRWDETRFGLEYDLDVFNIVAVSDFNMGAMENKSLNVFNAKYILADPDTATDDDYAAIESIVAHEYFHNWTGNRVTCRDWFQLSLKEGLTVFRDQEFSADMRSRAVRRIRDVRTLRAAQFPEDAGPLAHPVRPESYVEINNFYTATVYEKGAEVIGMIQTLLGRDGFRKGIDLYFRRHDGEAVTCDDFVQAMEDATGADLSQFRLWYSQAGTPHVEVEGRYHAGEKAYDLTLRQHTLPTPGQPEKLPLVVPLRLGLVGRSGRPLAIHLEEGEAASGTGQEIVIVLNRVERTFRFRDVPEVPVVSINRGFSAPVIIESEQGYADHAFLMAHDTDPFNRWEAGQQYATRLLLDMIGQVQAGKQPKTDGRFIAAVAKNLKEETLDHAFRAQMLLLPSEDFLGQQMPVVDVDAIHTARESLKHAVAERLKRQLLETYHENSSNRPFSPDASSAGRRALRNTALGYIGALPDRESLRVVCSQYDHADNMTDRIAALRILVDLPGNDRELALADFAARFAGNPIVMDKWFALQAMSTLPETLGVVRRLMEHPGFRITNPNRVRALIGVFASANPLRFHAASGEGYRFLADQILQLDPINPQVAARMLTPLGRWRKFDEKRRHLMKAELERILASGNLSRDVYEIASKSLA